MAISTAHSIDGVVPEQHESSALMMGRANTTSIDNNSADSFMDEEDLTSAHGKEDGKAFCYNHICSWSSLEPFCMHHNISPSSLYFDSFLRSVRRKLWTAFWGIGRARGDLPSTIGNFKNGLMIILAVGKKSSSAGAFPLPVSIMDRYCCPWATLLPRLYSCPFVSWT
jgi:hypothetical protein